jgi:RNA polymerase sigma factor (sigma-70 family)
MLTIPRNVKGLEKLGDSELVTRCRQRDEAAWREMVWRYHRLVYSIAQRYGLDHHSATEVFTAAFSELWRSLDQIEQPDQVRAWLSTVARRRSLFLLREQARWVSLDQPAGEEWMEPIDPNPVGDTVLIAAEREQALRDAIDSLSSRCRSLLEWLFYTDPVPAYEEIAERLGLSRNSIGFLRSRCLKKLRDAFEMQRIGDTGRSTTEPV